MVGLGNRSETEGEHKSRLLPSPKLPTMSQGDPGEKTRNFGILTDFDRSENPIVCRAEMCFDGWVSDGAHSYKLQGLFFGPMSSLPVIYSNRFGVKTLHPTRYRPPAMSTAHPEKRTTMVGGPLGKATYGRDKFDARFSYGNRRLGTGATIIFGGNDLTGLPRNSVSPVKSCTNLTIRGQPENLLRRGERPSGKLRLGARQPGKQGKEVNSNQKRY